MSNDHPFQLLFESFGRLPIAHAETVNRKAYEDLIDVLETPIEGAGRCILLRAPRAGHGKTHLLSRVQFNLSGTHEFIPVQALGSRIDALSVTEDALKRLSRSLPAAGGLTVLDLVVRRLFAFALQPLVISGEVPCQDREGALAALKSRPVETFDFHHPNAVTAHWARENFEVLGPRLSLELANRSGMTIRDVSFWVNAFFRYAATPIDHPGRTSALGFEIAVESVTESLSMDRLIALLGMLSLLMRVVLVADDLEGFSADETAALKFAAFIGALRQSVDRIDVILSMNRDVWDTAFVPRLSGGLADRLSEVLIELKPLSDEDIVALFDSRAPGLGSQVLERVEISERHARGLIRAAGEAWVQAANEKREPEVSAPVIEAEPEISEKTDASDGDAEPESEPIAEKVNEPLDDEPVFPIDEVETTDEPEVLIDPAFQRQSGSVFEAEFVDEVAESKPFSESWTPPTEDIFQERNPAASEELSAFTIVRQDVPVIDEAFKAPQESQLSAQAEASPFIAVHDSPQEPQFVAKDEPSPFIAVSDTPSTEFTYGTPAQTPEDFGPTKFGEPEPLADASDPEADRVDDLLRQFRERYGRGGL